MSASTSALPPSPTSPTARLRDLAAATLLGADRSGGDSAAKIATDAAIAGAMSRAGYRGSIAHAPLPPCPSEQLQSVSAASSATLARLLADGDPVLVEEWLTLAKLRNLRIGHSSLPALLDWGVGRAARTPLVLPVLGARGTWLASLNPSWSALVGATSLPADPVAAWSTSATSDRLLLLTAVRRERPELAPQLLASTAKEDGADERRRFIALFEVGLSPEDEAFLESSLDDRSKLVREAGATLLASLPNSAYVQRMTARALNAVQFQEAKKGLLRKKSVALAIALPKTWDAAFERDALEQKPPSGIGERAWWLQQIIARTPPASLFGTTPPDAILQAISDSEYSDTLPAALRESAARFGDIAWSIAVAQHELNLPRKGKSDNLPTVPAGLSTDHAASIIHTLIADDRFNCETSWAYAAGIPRPWPLALSHSTLTLLAKKKPKAVPQWYEIGPAIEDISRSIHPDASQALDALLRTMFKDDLPPSITKSLDRLTLRSDMHKEFHS
ncbi:MAG: hypothetical protein JNK16_08745 [Phycisphaerales bacterium]|nr:hypothetical protein [Phycisphaerales bacterium]